ncbi:hypothetical protein B0H13DRAFT_1894429 [Mycena leptocephala]|nr:hypothetical protein B0H13DRAFT_1894429 [Mycena leptocephala]
MATTAVIGFTTGTTAVVGFTTEHYKPLQQKSGFADVCKSVSPILSFFGGPRTCLGRWHNRWRFAISEMQVFICELIGKFSFALPKDSSTRARSATTLQLMSDGEKGVILCVNLSGLGRLNTLARPGGNWTKTALHVVEFVFMNVISNKSEKTAGMSNIFLLAR